MVSLAADHRGARQGVPHYALDFWGFGESVGTSYTVDTYVEMVNQFLDRLGIIKAPLIGHSMGGTVSLSTAMRYPEKVVKVAVIGSPIHGSSLNVLLKLSGMPAIAALLFRMPPLLSFFTFVGGYLTTPARRLPVLPPSARRDDPSLDALVLPEHRHVAPHRFAPPT